MIFLWTFKYIFVYTVYIYIRCQINIDQKITGRELLVSNKTELKAIQAEYEQKITVYETEKKDNEDNTRKLKTTIEVSLEIYEICRLFQVNRYIYIKFSNLTWFTFLFKMFCIPCVIFSLSKF